MENLNELVSLNNQVDDLRLQDKLGKQNFREDRKKVFEPFTDTSEKTSEILTKTVTETSVKRQKNKALENINEKVLELMKDKGMIAPNLAFFLFDLFKP